MPQHLEVELNEMDIDSLSKDEIKLLDDLSDKVRKGEGIGMQEAMLVISYQEAKKAKRKQMPWWKRWMA